jgi:branched-subunit amino acid transport protein
VTLLAILVLAGGTYGFRACGPLLQRRIELSEPVRRMLSVAATVLLCALVATSALTAGHGFAGWARPAGVLVGGVLAARRAPFIVAVAAAVATTAVLRLLGVR